MSYLIFENISLHAGINIVSISQSITQRLRAKDISLRFICLDSIWIEPKYILHDPGFTIGMCFSEINPFAVRIGALSATGLSALAYMMSSRRYL
jgi:hypothetical protein